MISAAGGHVLLRRPLYPAQQIRHREVDSDMPLLHELGKTSINEFQGYYPVQRSVKGWVIVANSARPPARDPRPVAKGDFCFSVLHTARPRKEKENQETR